MIIIPSEIGVVQEAISFAAPSNSTTQSLHAPILSSLLLVHKLGISTPNLLAVSKILSPGIPFTLTPLIVKLISVGAAFGAGVVVALFVIGVVGTVGFTGVVAMLFADLISVFFLIASVLFLITLIALFLSSFLITLITLFFLGITATVFDGTV